MSIFLSPSDERNFHFLLDKSTTDDGDESGKKKEQVKLWVCKEFLAIVSPVFRAMFYGAFKEAQAKDNVYLPGKNDEDFLKFLECLFPYPTRKKVDKWNILALLPLADEYQVDSLMKKCDRYYERQIRAWRIGDERLLPHLPILLKYKLNRAINAMVPYSAALGFEELRRYRSRKKPLLDVHSPFFSAVFEAKLSRIENEKHKWSTQYLHDSICSKCKVMKSEVDSGQHPQCQEFHTCSWKDHVCLCGYDFEPLHFD